MSLESAKAFVERMKMDETFRNKVSECKDKESRRALVLAEGYNFSKEEIKSELSVLSDEDLNNINAGWGTTPWGVTPFCEIPWYCQYLGFT
ncbi:MAG: Nif11-like leader peptide family natural product precursor [Candidatus Eremiobacterota bacterium]